MLSGSPNKSSHSVNKAINIALALLGTLVLSGIIVMTPNNSFLQTIKLSDPNLGGVFLISTLLAITFERFLYYFTPKLYTNKQVYILIYLLALSTLLITKTIININPYYPDLSLQYLIPIPIVVMLISLLLTPNLAMISGTLISILVALNYQNDLSAFIYLFCATVASTFASHNITKRVDIVKAGYNIGLINIITITALSLTDTLNTPIELGFNWGLGFGCGLFSAMLTLAFYPYFESIFRLDTSLTLLENTNINHPLLKRLMLTAPGTYQHSLMVGNLAEAAADAIGADCILTRTGAYFHDIGKLKRPSFFIENQTSQNNPHNALTPRMSKSIISSHPQDGLALAKKHKLPKSLHPFILEHHGTSLVSFFYTQELNQQNKTKSKTEENKFRYPGPKPQSKESGIVMLADSIEASVRSISDISINKINQKINDIIQNKLIDNQLSESNLTLNEIEIIKSTFSRIFKSIYHSRLDYKKEVEEILKKDPKS